MFDIVSYGRSLLNDIFQIRGRPVVINFPITDNCNSRCVMCNVWQEKADSELTPGQIREVLSNTLFKNVRHIGISGGEPTLRSDLVGCVHSVLDSLPRLETISITSHGYHSNRWSRFLPLIKEVADEQDVAFSLNLSLDGIGDKHDEIRGIKGAFERTVKTAHIAREVGVPVQFQCTVSRKNLYHIGKVLRYAASEGFEVIFRKAVEIERLYNSSIVNGFNLDKYEESYLADFFASDKLMSLPTSRSRRLYYKKMAASLERGGDRDRPCHFQRQGLFLGSKGEMFNCSLSKDELGNALSESPEKIYFSKSSVEISDKLIHEKCSKCFHDQSGAWSPVDILKDAARKAPLLNSLAKFNKAFHGALNCFVGFLHEHGPRHKIPSNIDVAYVIGAYGGEHVGDAAILGGVCLRLLRDHGVSRVYVESFRPKRTLKWLSSLVLPLDVVVVEKGSSDSQRAYATAGMVVYGGGPLMELPFQLAKHYRTLASARKNGKLVIVEGVGIGPLKTKLSRALVRRILSLSDHCRVRTETALCESIKMGVEAQQDQDPAFDYLNTRIPDFSRSDLVLNWIDENTTGDLFVGINIRPLWSKYNLKYSGKSTSKVYSEFISDFSDSLIEFSNSRNGRVSFLFFPMNPDQYGFSDLDAAYDLEEALGEQGVKLSILEYEPGVDELLTLLERMHCVISMRFHGCIFALSIPGKNVIGIDYQIGGAGKVTEVMGDRGLTERVLSVDNFDRRKFIALLDAAPVETAVHTIL